MKSSLLKRIDIVEKEMGTSIIAEKERIIVIPYPANNEAEFERLLQERMAEMREKYGPNVTESDFLVIGVRKFYRKEGGQSCEV